MYTIQYKGLYIHGYIDKPECTVQFANGRGFIDDGYRFKSQLAAKQAITRLIKR